MTNKGHDVEGTETRRSFLTSPTSFALTDEERTELRVQAALHNVSQSKMIGLLLRQAVHRGELDPL